MPVTESDDASVSKHIAEEDKYKGNNVDTGEAEVAIGDKEEEYVVRDDAEEEKSIGDNVDTGEAIVVVSNKEEDETVVRDDGSNDCAQEEKPVTKADDASISEEIVEEDKSKGNNVNTGGKAEGALSNKEEDEPVIRDDGSDDCVQEVESGTKADDPAESGEIVEEDKSKDNTVDTGEAEAAVDDKEDETVVKDDGSNDCAQQEESGTKADDPAESEEIIEKDKSIGNTVDTGEAEVTLSNKEEDETVVKDDSSDDCTQEEEQVAKSDDPPASEDIVEEETYIAIDVDTGEVQVVVEGKQQRR